MRCKESSTKMRAWDYQLDIRLKVTTSPVSTTFAKKTAPNEPCPIILCASILTVISDLFKLY